MKAWSFYDPDTGLFSKRVLHCNARAVEINTPDGFVAMEGEYDHLSQRVDLETGEVIDYQPPQPDDDHEWIGRRWVLRPEAATRLAKRDAALHEIRRLERDEQPRAQREWILGQEGAEDRLKRIEDKIRVLRAEINAAAARPGDKQG